MPDTLNEQPAGKNKDKNKMTRKDAVHAAIPALLYTVLTNTLYALLQLLPAGKQFSGLQLQAVISAICLAVFGWWALGKERIRLWGTKKTLYRYPAAFCYVCAVIMWGIACNQLIFISGIKEVSEGYRHVTRVFYGNSILPEIITLCIMGPLLEELVYRGLVYRRFQEKGSRITAAAGSAVIFGAMHFNLVQGIYAFAAGLLLAYIVAKTGSLATAAAAHGAMNLVSVLWTETGWLDFLNQTGKELYILIAVCLMLTVIFLSDANHLLKKQ